MHKLLIVEDEIYVRKSLEKQINWHALGCVVAGAVDSAEAALDFLEKESVEIILSDIRMDDMDGLELARRVKAQNGNIKIIFLTGYSEFAYAQEAIKIHVDDFILKPTDPAQLAATITKVVANIEEEQAMTRTHRTLKAKAARATEPLREQFIRDLLSGYPIDQQAVQRRAQSLSLCEGCMIPVLFISDTIPHTTKIDQSNVNAILKKTRDNLRQSTQVQLISLSLEPSSLLAILRTENPREAELFAHSALTQNIATDSIISASIGPICNSWETLPISIMAAREATDRRFYLGLGKVLLPLQHHKEADSDKNRRGRELIPAFLNLLKAGDAEAACALLKKMERIMRTGEEILADRSFLAELSRRMVSFCKLEEQTNPDSSQFITSLLTVSDAATLIFAFDLLAQGARKIADLVTRVDTSSRALIIAKAFDFIELHYTDPIGVPEVAAAVCKNPKYLCRVVKQETGKTVMDRIHHIRMNKALEYLADPRLQIGAVALRVGIKDSQYFTKLFRKTYGVTPSEHRRLK